MPTNNKAVTQLIYQESLCMVAFLNAQGKSSDLASIKAVLYNLDPDHLSPEQLEILLKSHAKLAEAIKPATPGSLYYIQSMTEALHKKRKWNIDEHAEGKKWPYKVFKTLGKWKARYFVVSPLPIINNTIGIALLALTCIISIVASGCLNENLLTRNSIINTEVAGLTLIYHWLLLLGFAALGVCFYNLYTAQHFISKRTYDEVYISTYWIRLVVGIISGIILSEFFFDVLGVVESTATDGNAKKLTLIQKISKPLLALLGGFAADLVYAIIQRIKRSLQTLFGLASQDYQLKVEELNEDIVQREALQQKQDLALKLSGLLFTVTDDATKALIASVLQNLGVNIPMAPASPPEIPLATPHTQEQDTPPSSPPLL